MFTLGLGPLAVGGWARLAETARGIGLAGLLASSTLQALASTALSLAIGIPAAYVFARCEFPGRKALSVVLAVPFVLPTVVVASAFTALGMGRGLGTVLAAHVFYNVSIVVRIVGTAWANLDPRLGEAARVLGARRGPSLAALTLRLVAPAIAAAGLLVFCYCFTSFGVVLLLGGPRVATLETEIWRQAVRLADLGAAGLLALLQLAATGVLMALYARVQRRLSAAMRQAPAAASRRRPRTAGRWIAVAVFGYGTAALVALPLAGIVAGSLVTRSGIGFAAWTSLFRNATGSLFWTSPLDAARTSLLFAAGALVAALAVGLPAAYAAAGVARREGRRAAGPAALFDLAVLLPLGTSAVTLGFGFLVALDRPPLDLRASALLVPIAHALVALPLVTRSLSGPIASLDPRLREAAAVLGATPARSWRCRRPPRARQGDRLGRGLRLHGVDRRVRGLGPARPARVRHDSRGHLRPSRHARRAEPGAGARHEHGADARVRPRRGRDRAPASAGAWRRGGLLMPFLEWRGLVKRYAGHAALDGVTLSLERRGVLAVLGPSGCGKTTLLRVTAGLEPPDAGTVLLDGADLGPLPPERRGIGLVFQDYVLFPHLDVAGNVGFGLRMARWPRRAAADRVRDMLDLVGLAGYERRRVQSLSGGEQQRVALARGLAPAPGC